MGKRSVVGGGRGTRDGGGRSGGGRTAGGGERWYGARMWAHRGHRQRPQMEVWRMGVVEGAVCCKVEVAIGRRIFLCFTQSPAAAIGCARPVALPQRQRFAPAPQVAPASTSRRLVHLPLPCVTLGILPCYYKTQTLRYYTN